MARQSAGDKGKVSAMKHYINALLIALSRVLNTILGGSPSMTLSSRAGLNYRQGKWIRTRTLINKIFWRQDDHCELAIKLDREFNKQVELLLFW